MYESPILVAIDELHRDIIKKQDDYIFLTVEKALKCEVNREELLKALAYDRDQYDKGFRDGRAYKPPIETNADRIRAMTDEELAHLLHSAEEHMFTGNLWDYEQWRNWLKQKAEEGDDA